MNAVIKPWLIACLVIALAGSVLLSAVLIVQLSRFDDSKRQAEEAEARANSQRTELAKLDVEVEALSKQKDALAPTIAEWQQRLKEKAVAEAALAGFDAKQRQAEADFALADKRREDVNRALIDVEKQKLDISATVERLKIERDALKKANTDAKLLTQQIEEAERRLNSATNALANVEARRKQFETDASSAQTRFEQIQKEADDLRQAREKLNNELAALRQMVQMQKDQLATFEQKAAELKAVQSAAQQEEQKVSKSQQQLATIEARTAELELRQRQAVSEFAQITNRLEQARRDATDAETKRDIAKASLPRVTQDLAAAQKLLAETQALQDQRAREHAALVAQVAAAKSELEQARKDGANAAAFLDAANATRRLSQDLAAKQGDLNRDVSRLEALVERLKKEKETLEKENGRLEAQRPKVPPDGQK